MNQEYTY